MRIALSLSVLFVSMLATSSLSFADFDSRCLRDCFNTGHECHYCSYLCYYDYYTRPPRNYPYVDRAPCEINNTR